MTPPRDRSHEPLGGRYRLSRLLAEGGMGEVWRARDELLHRDVAVKLLRPSLASDAVVAERFRREARAAASMSHPNMANVFDFVEEDHRPGIVMELVDGETLADTIAREAPMDPKRAVALIDQVLDALAAAHAAGVVHRDVKPGNVIVDAGGQVRVTDFGIARAAGDSTLTDTGAVLGTAHYVSPEQLEGAGQDPSSDLYATAVMLYEMLTGARPFEAETPIAAAMLRLTNDPQPARAHVPGIPAALDAVVMRALSREPSGRFAGAAEMRAALDAAADGATPPPAPAVTMPRRPDPTMQFSAEAAPTEVVGRVPPPTRSLGAPRRSRFLRPPWIWLVVAVIVWVGIGVVASRPKNTTVPKIAGMQLAAAERAASDAGLRIDPAVDVTYTTNARPKGTVLLVTPSPGATVRRGTHLHLTVSNGPPPCCTVPLVTGKTLPDATAALEAAQLQIGLVSYRAPTEHEQSGIVVDQTPNAGVTLKPGDQVDIVVTSQPAPAGHKKKDHEG